MAKSKYPHLNRVLREVQEVCGMDHIDGLIGRNTEAAVAKALANYDGNDVLGYLADLPHRIAEQSSEIVHTKIDTWDNPWIELAHSYIGLEEIVGEKHNEQILEFWKLCHLPFKTDETAWCAGYVGGVLEQSGIRSTRSGLARSYLNWGYPLERYRYGAIAVFWRISRHSGSGHVAFAVAPPSGGFISVLGGNQGNRVCIKPYPVSRLLGYRWVKFIP